MIKVYDRYRKQVLEEEQYKEKALEFLYNNAFGRIILKIIIRPGISKLVGKYYDSSLSTKKIDKFIKDNHIKMSNFETKEYKNFNEFFTRKKKNISFSDNENDFCSPADSKVTAYKITDDLKVKIKHSTYTLEELLKNNEPLDDFKNGNLIVFRLSVEDYHRYHYIDDGKILKKYFIKGKLHTVRSISEKYNFYAENSRACTLLETKNFGKVYYIEVGALLVGKIVNNDVCEFKRGEEKGRFEYGGSTVALITNKDVIIDEDIVSNSNEGIETQVCVGEKIGKI